MTDQLDDQFDLDGAINRDCALYQRNGSIFLPVGITTSTEVEWDTGDADPLVRGIDMGSAEWSRITSSERPKVTPVELLESFEDLARTGRLTCVQNIRWSDGVMMAARAAAGVSREPIPDDLQREFQVVVSRLRAYDQAHREKRGTRLPDVRRTDMLGLPPSAPTAVFSDGTRAEVDLPPKTKPTLAPWLARLLRFLRLRR